MKKYTPALSTCACLAALAALMVCTPAMGQTPSPEQQEYLTAIQQRIGAAEMEAIQAELALKRAQVENASLRAENEKLKGATASADRPTK